jgi:hypothetical protein
MNLPFDRQSHPAVAVIAFVYVHASYGTPALTSPGCLWTLKQ